MKKILLNSVFLISTFQGLSQVSGLFPLPLLKYQDQSLFENPASAARSELSEITLLRSNYTGLGESIGLNYLNASVALRNKNSTNVHMPGIVLHSEFDTEILTRTRVYLKYNWSTSISNSTKISAGAHFGFFNYAVKASNSSSGISAFAPDATIGIWITSKNANLGFSIPQLLNSTVQPINSKFTLLRYYTLFADYKLVKNLNTEFSSGIKILSTGSAYIELTGFLNLLVARNFATEFSYKINKGFTFSAGITKFSILKNSGDLFVSYFHSSKNIKALSTDRIELCLRYSFKKKQKAEQVESE